MLDLKRIRKNIMTMLQVRCPENEEVAKMAEAFGVERKRVERFKLDNTENCVLCGLCTKACKELGTGAISTVNRGIYKEVDTPYHEASPACIGCGSCANVCPTNAINIVDKDGEREIWGKKFKLVKCTECGETFATEEHIRFAYEKIGKELDMDKILCDKCKRKAGANEVKEIYEKV